MMEPCFFNTSAEPLFGIHVLPASAVPCDEAVLLCSPIGHEYHRAHWALRQLADQLARAGFHVLRFDYTGHGDSWGQFEAASRAHWVADVRTALAELRDASGAGRVSIVGLRMGAALAFEAANALGVQQLVLWDPIVHGLSYVQQLRQMQHDRGSLGLPVASVSGWAGDEELVGYRYRADLVRTLAAVDLAMLPRPRAKRIRIVASADRPEYRLLHERLGGSELEICADAGDWDEVQLHAESLLIGPLQRVLLAAFKGDEL